MGMHKSLEEHNLTMLTDLYQMTMMNGYMRHGIDKRQAVYDMFFRHSAGHSAYAVVAGLEQVIGYIRNLRFSQDDLAYLRSLKLFDEAFLTRLKTFRFTGDLYAMPEGTMAFPNEPLVRVQAPLFEAQFIETALLNIVNHQTLIATKASRMRIAADGDAVLEFGLRRAQGPDAGIFGARAAIIGGCQATSNVMAGQLFDVPVRGTHAHSWVMGFEDELSAFRAYAEVFPESCLLLVDTYDTLLSGVPNAITVFRELRQKGYEPVGIRLDSGDFAYLSKAARAMLDEAGFQSARIFASSDLDEETIRDLKAQGACVDVWAVGTKLITSDNRPALGGVYKLAAIERDGVLTPRIKISDNPAKISNPGLKKVFRLYSQASGKTIADLITLDGETIDESQPLTIFDPVDTWKRMKLNKFRARELLVPVFIKGELVYNSPDIHSIAAYARQEMDSFWEEYKRLRNPHVYKVDLSDTLYALKSRLLQEAAGKYI